jgi:thiamine biosynthesis protein ThiI
MMDYDTIIVRYGEMSTKGKNKRDFIYKLASSIENELEDYKDKIDYSVRHDHIFLFLKEKNLPIADILKNIQGLYSFSLALKIDADIDNILSTSLTIMKKEEGKTFKIYTHRIDKSYPFISDEINRKVAGNILKNTSWMVDVHNPDKLLSIEIREDGAYLFLDTIKGLGGYPKGSTGRCLLMISGGIDSPVAAYLLMKRGVTISCVHFASPPYTNSGVITKLEDLLTVLSEYQGKINLFIVPFTKIQEKIYEVASEGYPITIMRRMMYRLAVAIAKKNHIPVIASGESIGQVASQTLESLVAINEVTNMPIIRPLATYDKVDIIKIANEIGTYDISIRPFEDCCTIFPVKKPKTAPHLDICHEIEEKFDFTPLLEEAVTNTEIKVIREAKDL